MRGRPWQMLESTCERAEPYEESLMAVKIVCMHSGLLNLNLWISDLRNCWQLLITIGLHKIVSRGRIISGYSCYDSKHKIIMGIVVLLTRDPQLSKSISVVDRIANSYWIWLLMSLLGYGTINLEMIECLAIWWMCQGYTL